MRKGFTAGATLLLFALAGWPESPAYAGCECPKIACDSCEFQVDVKFYSETCEGAKLRSCVRPVCKIKDPLPQECEGLRAQVEAPARQPAAANEDTVDVAPTGNVEVGRVHDVVGSAWVTPHLGKKTSVVKDAKIYESDVITTDRQARVKIVFVDRNEIVVSESSELKLAEYAANQQADKRRVLLELIRGKVRNDVKQRYEGTKSSSYEVRTPTAVAGVRGTRFTVAFEEADTSVTKVQTLEGHVEMRGADGPSTVVQIKAGQTASHVATPAGVFSDGEKKEFLARGYMTPVHDMSGEEIRRIAAEAELRTLEELQRMAAATPKSEVCREPQADFNQCAWTCEGNPNSQKVCRTDLPKVRCVRRRCNANGQWAEETRLPASINDECPAQGARVAPCNY